jgi:hypothetical protein
MMTSCFYSCRPVSGARIFDRSWQDGLFPISSFGVAIVNFSSTFHIPLIAYHHLSRSSSVPAETPQKGAFVPFWICSISAAGAMPRSEGSAVDAASSCWLPQRTSTPQRRRCYSKESSSRCARLCVATTAAKPSKRAQLLPRGRCKPAVASSRAAIQRGTEEMWPPPARGAAVQQAAGIVSRTAALLSHPLFSSACH